MSKSNPQDPQNHDKHTKGVGTHGLDALGDDAAEVGRGQYGVAEEPAEFKAVDLSQTPKTPDQIARDKARDEEVKNTGEDLA
jgi:hypothetical protein